MSVVTKFLVALGMAPLIGCITAPISTPAPETSTPPPVSKFEKREFNLQKLQLDLGLGRDLEDLGFAQKAFDGCRFGVKDSMGKCGANFLTVVNFRLRCRDSEGTTQEVVTNFTPLESNMVKWRLLGVSGITSTNSEGFGTIQIVTPKSPKGQRLVLTVGRQFLGIDISEVSQIVVPEYWCGQAAS